MKQFLFLAFLALGNDSFASATSPSLQSTTDPTKHPALRMSGRSMLFDSSPGIPAPDSIQLSCESVTVELDLFGSATLLPSDIPFNANIFCGSLTPTSSPANYACPDAGTVRPYLLTVQDTCGKIGACTIEVTILPSVRCTPELTISDPCACKNNATSLTDGQFEDELYIRSLSGKTWTIAASGGLFDPNSPAPPAAPFALSNGTAFQEIPAGSGDYYLKGIHTDALGYNLTAISNEGEQLSISNLCSYPTPVIDPSLQSVSCLASAPVELSGTTGDAQTTSEAFAINGIPATTFDPGTVGLGTYIITYTVDGGAALTNGPDDPGCIQAIEQQVQVVATTGTVVCNNLVQVSLDEDCSSEVTPDMVLEGTYACFDDYSVSLTTLSGNPIGNTVNGSHIGQTLIATVEHLLSGNSCWGNVVVEDKLPPTLSCSDSSLPCVVSEFSPAYLTNVLGVTEASPEAADNCTAFDLNFKDQLVTETCDNPDAVATINRVWTATDAYDNQSSCIQIITLERLSLDDIILPEDTIVSCENPVTIPDSTGNPYIVFNGLPFPLFPDQSYCDIHINFSEKTLVDCDGTYKLLREWFLQDDCLPGAQGTNPLEYIQLIKVLDDAGPVFTCPENITVNTNVTSCVASVDLPDVIITDNCSRVASISADWHINGVAAQIQGSLADFPGNNYWEPDTLGVLGYAHNLPQGNIEVRYMVSDDCGKLSSCSFVLHVDDDVPPVAACDEFTKVSLGIDGSALINASTFDDGSYDNCNGVSFKARRLEFNTCQPTNRFFDQVKFCCNDIGDSIDVLLRVFDLAPPNGDVSLSFMINNSFDCIVKVFVEDKIKPACLAPPDVSVSCENFDESLWAYGYAEGVDNCCMDTVRVSESFFRFDTVCNKGTVFRTFRAFDCAGNRSTCTQTITVTLDQDYAVRFPDDVIIYACDSTGMYGEPEFMGEDCELLGVSFEDKVFTVVPDACMKIERTWKVINWCTYDPNKPCIAVPNPEPSGISNSPGNLPGPTVSPSGTPFPWEPTQAFIRPGDTSPTDFSTFWSADANCYVYKQFIKILDREPPAIGDCPDSLEVCDLSSNDAFFWNDNALWDAATMQHDLCEAPSNLSITASDDCSGADVSFHYLLFLDLDQDGDMETVVSSANPPGYNNINLGNAGNPNYTGGTPIAFDDRPVPANLKYGFTIQVTQSGNTKKARVAWNTALAPNNYFEPILPYGKHKIKWIVGDNCGNQSTCEYPIEIKDCKPPTVVCINGLSVNLMPTGDITLWASDFLQYGDDNCTPAAKLEYSIRKSGTGTGFPLDAQGNPISNISFNCNDLGSQEVELWARDLAGNVDYCETTLEVQDNNGVCGAGAGLIAGVISTYNNAPLEDAFVTLTGNVSGVSIFNQTISDQQGNFIFTNAAPPGADVTITPEKDDNPLNGVSTYDLVLISKHILGLEPLNSPYKMIAADANRSGSITTFDIVELRKLILGIYTSFPNNTSWRFVDAGFDFSDPNNPFKTGFPEKIAHSPLTQPYLNAEHFVAVKTGDVNGTAIANTFTQADDRMAGELNLQTADRQLDRGEVFEASFTSDAPNAALQFTLNLNGLEVVDIIPGSHISLQHFGVFENSITASIDEAGAEPFHLVLRAQKPGRLSDMLQLSDQITRSEAYHQDGSRMNVALKFEQSEAAKPSFQLYQNTPNPFISKTQIGFYLPEASEATLSIHSESGRVIFQQTARYEMGYNVIHLDRSMVPASGVLYYTLAAQSGNATRKLIVLDGHKD